jgi:hypothetical protein
LNTLIAVLDPNRVSRSSRVVSAGISLTWKSLNCTVHDLQFIRTSSSILTTAILYASARFWHPQLAPICHDHLLVLTARSFVQGTFDIGFVQGIMICTFWREPGDRSAWAKTGLAIRVAQQLHLHLSLRQREAGDPIQAKLLLVSRLDRRAVLLTEFN